MKPGGGIQFLIILLLIVKGEAAAAQDADKFQRTTLDSARKKEICLIRIWTEQERAKAFKDTSTSDILPKQNKNALYNSNNEVPVGNTSRQPGKNSMTPSRKDNK